METKKFDEIFDLMNLSFPKNEFRSYEMQKNLLNNKSYKIITRENEEGKIIAFMALWEFDKFIFIEHLAVNPSCRGTGMGSKIMKDFLENAKKPIILEIEPPTTEISIRRKNFYERLGFKLNNYIYYQLPLHKEDEKTALNLMSFPEIIAGKDFEDIQKTIYENVYPKF